MVPLLGFHGAQQSRQGVDVAWFLDIFTIHDCMKADHRLAGLPFGHAEMHAREASCPCVSAKEKKGRCMMMKVCCVAALAALTAWASTLAGPASAEDELG